MKTMRNKIPLLLVVAIIVVAIAMAGCTSSEKATEGPTVVTDAPETPGQSEGQPLIPEEEPTAAPATPEPEAETPTATPQEEPTVLPTPKVESATPTPTPEPEVAESSPDQESELRRRSLQRRGMLPAQEIVGITAWINSQPLKISDLRGKVVLVDFWTYTCVNCIRTFPYLKLWHVKYADDGLVIVGVHSPEFSFEEKLENVSKAVKDNSIGWPVALDNDFATWKAYQNRYWPAKYLIDKDGIIRYTHFGEGAYAETELKIRELLEEAGADPSQLDATLPSDQPLDPSYLNNRSSQVTRELYAGWVRGQNDVFYGLGGYIWNQSSDDHNKVTTYEDPGKYLEHLIYLQGPWYNGRESLKHDRQTSGFEDYIALRFSAKSVNAVIKPQGDEAGPFKVLVTLDGEYLTDSNKGEDVVIEEDGRSLLYVDEPRMYSLIQAPSHGTYELKLSSNSPHFALFAFTFGVYESGV